MSLKETGQTIHYTYLLKYTPQKKTKNALRATCIPWHIFVSNAEYQHSGRGQVGRGRARKAC